jgi:hypothetical protein
MAMINPPINPNIIRPGEGFIQVKEAVAISRSRDIAVLLTVPSMVIISESFRAAEVNIFEFNAGFPDRMLKCALTPIS